MNEPIKVFLSYSHQDDGLRKELGKHLSGLERNNLIKLWHDRDIEAGLNWAQEIDQNLEQAAIILSRRWFFSCGTGAAAGCLDEVGVRGISGDRDSAGGAG
jgi:TIR domain